MPDRHERLLGESTVFSDTLEQVSRLAALSKPVLVVGERGTGKELVAERVHYLSERWDQPFIKVNCAALTESLLEAELFGYEPGAFTGANRTHAGRFERADAGTLLLDELSCLSHRAQEKLLRLIEYGEFERLGGRKTLQVDVRLVASTNEDLPTLCEQGRFRHDLLDRLAFDVITLPPLRHRSEDIELLANQFAMSMCRELGWDYFAGFSAGALARLQTHNWPGNVRELKSVVERSLYRCDDLAAPVETIIFDPFDSPYRPGIRRQPAITAPEAQPPQNVPVSPKGMDAATLDQPLPQQVRQLEIRLIEQALRQHGYHQKRAAEALGLTYHQLRGYLRKYVINRNGGKHFD